MYSSIIICTRNRHDLILKCLNSLLNLDYGIDKYEVIVVDNGSTDITKEKVINFKSPFKLNYVYEPVPGLSRSRNKGLECATGDIVIYLDDDVTVHKDWLEQLTKPFDDHGDAVGIVAGDVDPIWEEPRPSWLTDQYLGFYSAGLNWDSIARYMKNDEWVLECNMAIRTHLLRKKGGFDESLGRIGDSLVSCEGIVIDQIRAEGTNAYFTPLARINHLMHSSRLNKSWLVKRCFAQGVSTAILSNYYPRTRNIPDTAVNIKDIYTTDIEALNDEQLFAMTMIMDRLGFVLKKKELL